MKTYRIHIVNLQLNALLVGTPMLGLLNLMNYDS